MTYSPADSGHVFKATQFDRGDGRASMIAHAIRFFDEADAEKKLRRANWLRRTAACMDDPTDKMILNAQAGKLHSEAHDLVCNPRR